MNKAGRERKRKITPILTPLVNVDGFYYPSCMSVSHVSAVGKSSDKRPSNKASLSASVSGLSIFVPGSAKFSLPGIQTKPDKLFRSNA